MEAVRGVVVLLLLYLNTCFNSAKCWGGWGSYSITVRVRHVLSSYILKKLFHYIAWFFCSQQWYWDGWGFCLFVFLLELTSLVPSASGREEQISYFPCMPSAVECFSTCENCMDSTWCLVRYGELFLYWRCYRQAVFLFVCFTVFLRRVLILEYQLLTRENVSFPV